MKDINIAFITERMIRGHGVDLVVDRLADGLARKGYSIKVYCNYFDETFTSRKSYWIERLHYFKPAANPIIYEQRIRRLVPYLNSKQVDLFIIQSFPFYSLIPKLNAPVLAVDHGIVSVTDMPLKRRLKFKYMNFSQNTSYFKEAEGLVTVSKYLLGCLPLSLRKKASFIYNGANHYKIRDVPSSEITDFRESMGVSADDILLLYVGRLNFTNQPYKGLAELVSMYQETYSRHKNLKLLAVGYGSKNDEEYLKNQGILAIGNAPESQMPLIYNSCDIYTTASEWEGFDLPIAEAQSFGKPTISFNIGAHPEVANDEKTGFLVKDNKQFKEKLEIMILNPDIRKKMGKNALEYSKDFTWENSVDNYNSLIKKMLKLEDCDIQPKPDINRYSPGKAIDVSVVIVNYNSSYPVMKECLDSLKRQTYKKIEIVIFDNNSSNPEVLDEIKIAFPGIQIIYSNRNLGYGGGLNRAINDVSSDLILISNFDVVYNMDAIEQMVSLLNKSENSYIGVAPKIKLYYQKEFIESIGLYLDSNLNLGHYGMGQLDMSQYNRCEDIFGVSFVSAMIRRRAFLEGKVGPVDPGFFLFYEDADFSYRAHLHGYKFRSCPQAILHHRHGYSFRDEASGFQTKYYWQKLNQLKTAYKNSEDNNLKRIISNEYNIHRSNFRDPNLRHVSKKILRDFQKSARKLRKERQYIQFSRQIFDSDVIKYCWGESVFFDIARNEPVYTISNLLQSYRRLFALLGNERYEGIVNYLTTLESTKFIIESSLFKDILHSKLEYEPISVHRFIDRLS
ncbi:MAG: glycosyltransferase [Actinomycetia bacterium]|nr:glycosyltransferase [Actinomycetes bacterium]